MGNGLRIHTQMGPAPAEQKPSEKTPRAKGLPAGGKQRAAAFGDRLLRSTAIACALLLSVMALRNADLPWAQRAVEGIEKAMTMRIDLDESLGKLHFVRELVPETALVFWNAGAPQKLYAPVEGQIEHAWSKTQPWRIYVCADSAPVCAAMDGEVSRVEEGAMADHIVLITHDNGLETVYAYLAEVEVSPGERVYAGDAVGAASAGGGARVYFALRQDGAEVDPAQWER
ncbi:MAG: M23 family metallopeptidase [Eubacteriales bacterium]|nr:M23 family metallopeptidase [Eubacteriales bacterium]